MKFCIEKKKAELFKSQKSQSTRVVQ